MRRIINWLFERIPAYSQTVVLDSPVVKIKDLEDALNRIELPTRESDNEKCAYRELVESLEKDNKPISERLSKCCDCLGYKKWQDNKSPCDDFVSVRELIYFWEVFK